MSIKNVCDDCVIELHKENDKVAVIEDERKPGERCVRCGKANVKYLYEVFLNEEVE